MLLVTGGAGFIGSNFVHEYIRTYNKPVLVLDKLTYAASLNNLMHPMYKPLIIFHEGDIGNHEFVFDLLLGYRVDSIINFAAESHVDRSIDNSTPFIETNVVGTENLLHAATKYYNYLMKQSNMNKFKFVHVSTDEVYGSLSKTDKPSTEESPYKPRSLYSATKAASDHIAMAYYHTHGLPVCITACSNNYGPRQHREKFIPTIITKALRNEKIPVYGDGSNLREWIYVTDHCRALLSVLAEGRPGEKYNIGEVNQWSNLEMAHHIVVKLLGKPAELIEFVTDRKGHDFRYDLNSTKVFNEFGWYPRVGLADGLLKTIEWYKNEEVNNEQDTRDNSGGGKVIETVSSDVGYYEATFADLRQTIDILSTDHINVGRNQGRSGDNESLGEDDIRKFTG